MERNAYVLETLLNNLKPKLALDPATNQPYKYTVIGPSMGGLISRYALAHMEQQQQLLADATQPADPWWDHNTAEWISLDVPHMGANIPLGDQHFLDFYKGSVESARANLEQRLNSTAAKQFLVAHYTYPGVGGAPLYRDRFVRALRDNGERSSMGFPVHLRRVALANGKLNGALPASNEGTPGGVAFNMEVKTRFLPSVGNVLLSLFGFSYGTTSTPTVTTSTARFLANPNASCPVFFGLSNQTSGLRWGAVGPTAIKIVTVQSGPQGSWDLAPGGLRDTQRQLHDQSEAGGKDQPFKVNVTNVKDNHCFIPTVSALGFQYRTMGNYQGTSTLPNPFTVLAGRNLVCDDEIPFDDFYAPSSTNTEHVKPDSNGLLFLSRELSNALPTPAFVLNPSAICPGGSATYSIQAECARAGQPGTTYTWTLGNGLQFANGSTGTGPSQTIQAVSGFTGGSTVTIVATRQGFAASLPLVRNVFVGNSTLSFYTQDNYLSSCEALRTYTVRGISLQGPYQWVVDGVAVGSGPTTTVFFNESTGPLTVSVQATALCPSGPLSYSRTHTVDFPHCTKQRISDQPAYPNPADASVTILLTDANDPTDTVPAGTEVTLYNGQGTAVLQKTAQPGDTEIQMNTAATPEGNYNVVVEKPGEAVELYHLEVDH